MVTSHKCVLCIGSNHEAEIHLKKAEETLNGVFRDILWGKIVRTCPEGTTCKSNDYLNCIASFDTILTERQVIEIIKGIEKDNGRTPDSKITGIMPLDIDLLQYGSRILRPSDFRKEYVRKAMLAFSQER